MLRALFVEPGNAQQQTNGSSRASSPAKSGNGKALEAGRAQPQAELTGAGPRRKRPPPHRPKTAPSVAVVVPTYNEADNLAELAARLFGLGLPDLRLYVVDDGSPDGTGHVAADLKDELDGRVDLIQRGSKQGIGTAYVEGFARAIANGADRIVQMDADMSHAPEALPRLLENLEEADVVVGSRYVGAAGHDLRASAGRRWLSGLSNAAIRLVTGLQVKDATSGFKAFRSDALRSLGPSGFRCSGFAFQVEVAHACERKGLRVVEHPITFANRTAGESKMSLAIVLEAFWKLLPLRLKR